MAQVNVNLAFSADTGKAKTQIMELQSLLSKIAYTGGTDKLQADLHAASEAAKELQFHLNNAFNVSTGNFDLSMLDRSLKTSGTNIQKLSMNLLNAGATGQQAFVKLAQSISLADQPMFRISNRMKEFAVTMKNTIKWQLSSSMLHGFMGAVQSAYGYAQDLNESLNNIRIVTGYNTNKMAQFAEQANKAAKALSTTTTDYTNASLIYFQQGLKDEEVAARTDITVKMANAVGQSTEVISQQLTAVWNNFDDGSKSLEYYADVMTALGAATASSTDEISEGLSKFAAVANTVGLSYEYATAALATLTSNTRESADVVGNSLKTLFARIQGLTLGETLDDGTDLNKYSQALAKVGISIYDANGGLKDMDNILDEMAAKWNTLNDAQQVALAQTVGGVRQYNQLIALMENWNNGDSDSMIANLQTIKGSEGSLQKQADIYAESWEAAEKRVQAAAEGIYQSLLDDKFFISLNNGFANLLNGIDAFIDKVGGIKTILVGVAGIIISIFANKIPSALDTLKYNLQVLTKGSQEAYKTIQNQMSEATKLAFEKGKIQQDSSMGYAIEQANKLTSARNQLALVSDKMSAAEKQAAEVELSLIERTQQEVIALKERNEELQKSISLSLTEIGDPDSDYGYQKGSLTVKKLSTYNNADYQLGIDTGLNTMEESAITTSQIIRSSIVKALTDAEVATKGLSDSFDPIDINLIKIQGALTPLGQQMIEISKSLKDFSQTDLNNNQFIELRGQAESFLEILPSGIRNLKQVRQAINDISSAKDINTLNTKWQDLLKILQKVTINSKNAGKALEGSANSKTIQKLIQDMKNLGDNTENTKNKVATLEQLFSKFNPGHTIRTSEALSSLSGIATNAVFALRNVISALNALNDPNLSGWEKFSSVLFSISTLAPSILSFSKDFVKIKNFVAQATEKAVIALTNENNLQKLLINTETQRSGIYGSYAAGKVLVSEAIVQGLNKEQQKSISLLMTEAALAQSKNELNDERKKELIAAVASTIAKDKEATESEKVAAEAIVEAALKGEVTKATWKQVAAQMGLNTAMLPYIAALTAIVAVIGLVVYHQKKQVEATRENAEAAREAAAASKEQVDSNQKLVDSYLETLNTYNEVKEAFASGKATSEQLVDAQNSLADSAIEVAEALGIEGAALAKLSGNYNQLTKDIINAQQKDIQEAIEKEEKAKNQTGEEFITYMREGKGYFQDDSYLATFDSGLTIDDEEFFNNADYSQFKYLYKEGGNLQLASNQDVESMMAAYEEVQELFDQATAIMTADQMNKSELYQNIKSYLNKSKESYEAYKASEENIQKYQIQAKSFGSYGEVNNAYEISNIEEYDQYANAMIKDLAQQKGILDENGNIIEGQTQTYEELTAAVHAYLGALEGVSDFASQSQAFDDIAKKTTIAKDELLKYYNALKTDKEKELFFKIAFKKDQDIEELDEELQLLQTIADGESLKVKIDIVSEGLSLLDDDATTEEIVAWAKKMKEAYGEAFNLEDFLGKSSNEQATYLQGLKLNAESDLSANRDQQIAEREEAIIRTQQYKADQESDWRQARDERVNNLSRLTQLQDYKNQYNKAISSGETFDFAELGETGITDITSLNSAITATEELISANDEIIQSYEDLDNQISTYQQEIENLEMEKQIEEAYGWRDALRDQSEVLGINYDEVQDYAAQLRKNHKELENNIELSEKIALVEKKQAKAADDLIDNYKDYTKVLNKAKLDSKIKDTEEYAQAIESLRKDISLLTGYEEEAFSDDFINSDAVQKALRGIAKGVKGSTEELQALATLEMLPKEVTVDLDKTSYNALVQALADVSQDIEIGTTINNSNALLQLGSLMEQAGYTVEQIQAAFNKLGWSPTIDYETIDVSDAEDYASNGFVQVVTGDMLSGYSVENVPLTAINSVATNGTVRIPKIGSAGSGGGAPSTPSFTKIDNPGNGSTKKPSSGGGGGGGGSSAPKHAEKKNDSDKERYHTLQNQLEDLKSEYDSISEAADQAFGKEKLEAIDDEINKTDELINKQEEYLDAISQNLPIDKAVMEAYYNNVIGGPAIEFDEKGNISNYDTIQDAMFDKYNQMTSLDEDSEEWQAFEKKYEQLEKYIEQYEETYDLLRDEEAEYQDLLRQRIDLQLEKVQYSVEIQLDIPENEIAIIEYQLGKIEDDAFKSAEAISLLTKKAENVYDQIQVNKQGLNDLLELSLSTQEIVQLMNGDMSVLEGKTFTEDQINSIKEYRDNLLDLNEELDDIRENIEEQVMEVFDAWNEKLEQGIDKLDHYGNVLESYKNIIDIVGKDTLGLSDAFMATLNQSSIDNAINKVTATKKSYEAMVKAQSQAEQALEDAKARNDEASIKMWEENLQSITEEAQSAREEMLSAWEDALNGIAEQFEATVERLIENFNDSIYKLGGLEGLSEDFSRKKETQDLYVSDYQKIYELSKLTRDINNKIDDTDNIAGKQKLKKLLEQINELQKDGVEMSQYDLEYLQAEYDLRLAELELEEARNAKNTVRLQKDNEGNWSYIYTQNTDAVDQAQQKYEDALYAMQDLSSQYIDEMSEKLISTSQEMQEAIAAVRIQDFESQDAYYKEIDRIYRLYQDQLGQQESELNKAVANNKVLYDTDWTNYHNATGYKISDTENFVTTFKDSLLGTLLGSDQLTSNFSSIIGETAGQLIENLMSAANDYYTNLNTAMEAAGTSTGTFSDVLAEDVLSIQTNSEIASNAVKSMAEQMDTSIGNIMSSVEKWQIDYGNQIDLILNKNLQLINSFNDMIKVLSEGDMSGIDISYNISRTQDQDTENIASGDTGMYTGNWGTKDGKLAILHEKELVLNANDTENMLNMLELTRYLTSVIDVNAKQLSQGIGLLQPATIKDDNREILEQQVHIQAEFPNVNDHNEIEEAFNSLINTASQYAYRK